MARRRRSKRACRRVSKSNQVIVCQDGRKEGRANGEGRKEGRKDGRTEGRKEGKWLFMAHTNGKDDDRSAAVHTAESGKKGTD